MLSKFLKKTEIFCLVFVIYLFSWVSFVFGGFCTGCVDNSQIVMCECGGSYSCDGMEQTCYDSDTGQVCSYINTIDCTAAIAACNAADAADGCLDACPDGQTDPWYNCNSTWVGGCQVFGCYGPHSGCGYDECGGSDSACGETYCPPAGDPTQPPSTPSPVPPQYAVSGKVFIDTNSNGQQDEGENNCYSGNVILTMGASNTTFASNADCSNEYSISNTSQCSPIQITLPEGYEITGWSGTDYADAAVSGTGTSSYITCP